MIALSKLLEEVDDPEEHARIKAEFDRAADAAERLIAANIEAHTAEYEKATAALQESVNALKAAKQAGERLADRISQVAAAVDKLVQLASKGGVKVA